MASRISLIFAAICTFSLGQDQSRPSEGIWATENDERWATHDECVRRLIRKNYTRCIMPWRNLTTVHLEDYHDSFSYKFTFPRSKCCYTVHLFSQDSAQQLTNRMSCEQLTQPRVGFYQLILSPDIESTSIHWCKTSHDEKKRENVTCGGVMKFDPTNQRSNIWHVFASKCGSRDGVDLAYSLNFTSAKDKCLWKQTTEEIHKWHTANPLRKTLQNASKDHDELERQYPISPQGMLAVAIITGLNTLLILVGFTLVFLKLKTAKIGLVYNQQLGEKKIAN